MNAPFVPEIPLPQRAADAWLTQSNALVTASYAPDLERCRLLCETVDRHVTGFEKHYLLVEGRDVPLFRQLESSRRVVIDERDILPNWLHALDDPLSGFRRRVWLSWRIPPLRGWHVQQLRRIGIAGLAGEDALIFCDSDVMFLKPFDCSRFWRGGRLRLLRHDNALDRPQFSDQHQWSINAGKLLGIRQPVMSRHDYISTVIAWRRQTVKEMCDHIEAVSGRDWVSAVASKRKFSECMIYGRYVDEVRAGEGHFTGDTEYCQVQWLGSAMTEEDLRDFVTRMEPEQVAICLQSFIGTDIGRLRRLAA
ncbi:MAG: hypothetical protein J0H34_05905 [Rhizobiales bacterium]|nr:hypothetical protein [Hyphomicrobiales bacterium]